VTRTVPKLLHRDGSLLLRELNHRINNELTCAICAISTRAMHADNVAVKDSLLGVVDLLNQSADVNRALQIPDHGHLADAASYIERLCVAISNYRLDHLAISVLFSADDLRLEGDRCWKLGLIVSELMTNVARHANFAGRRPELRVELLLAGNIVSCRVTDNGMVSKPVRRGRGLTIVDELVSSLGGRFQTFCAAEGSYFLITFPLTETCPPRRSQNSDKAEEVASPSAASSVWK
jgi:two-component sensor histidine kinase